MYDNGHRFLKENEQGLSRNRFRLFLKTLLDDIGSDRFAVCWCPCRSAVGTPHAHAHPGHGYRDAFGPGRLPWRPVFPLNAAKMASTADTKRPLSGKSPGPGTAPLRDPGPGRTGQAQTRIELRKCHPDQYRTAWVPYSNNRDAQAINSDPGPSKEPPRRFYVRPILGGKRSTSGWKGHWPMPARCANIPVSGRTADIVVHSSAGGGPAKRTSGGCWFGNR